MPQPGQTSSAEWHASFRLPPRTGAVFLSRLQNGVPAVIDGVAYQDLPAGRSQGPYPDGQPKTQRSFAYPTPAAPNNPAYPPLAVRINEWMASNTKTLLDPATQKYEDWFELYNAGDSAADLSGYTLSDSPTNAAKFVIPAGFSVPAYGHLLVWADEADDRSTNGELHVNFKLSQAGENLGLFAPDGRRRRCGCLRTPNRGRQSRPTAGWSEPAVRCL